MGFWRVGMDVFCCKCSALFCVRETAGNQRGKKLGGRLFKGFFMQRGNVR